MEKRPKLVGPKAIIIDILLAILFFFFMIGVCRSHVPANEEPYITLFAAFTSICMTGVFWMAVQCFRVTLVDQLHQRRSNNK